MPHKGTKRRKLLEFIMRLTPNSRSTYHLKRYFATGQITRQAASQIYRDYSRVVQRMLTPAAAAI